MWLPNILLALSLFGSTLSNAQNESANRALVEDFVALLNAGEYQAMIDMFTSPDSVYWINGSPVRTGISGNSTVGARISGYPEFIGPFDKFSLTPTSIVADGDVVMMEAIGRGEGPGTLLYLQTAVMTFRVVDGKLDSVKEYIDHQESQYLLSYRERYAQRFAGS
ncbi:hypothetical protein DL769_006907 [Monosporascus sp. CRB-8-3]|nr:hypothetical protein DL769_006907 [Monosporascus sp. CRB-8-3]